MAPTAFKSTYKNNFFSMGAEFRRCDTLKIRIKTYCKQQSITQNELADRMKVGRTAVSRFMSGVAGVQGDCYQVAMRYLKTRLPLSACTEPVKIIPTSSKCTLT